MTNTDVALIELSMEELTTIEAGFGIPGWLKTIGHAGASALRQFPPTSLLPVVAQNKKALAHGVIWGTGGAIAGSAGGVPGALLCTAGGFLSGYVDSLYTQHGG